MSVSVANRVNVSLLAYLPPKSPNSSCIGNLGPLPKVAEKTGVRKPSAIGILKIGAILRSLIGGDLASVCGKIRFHGGEGGILLPPFLASVDESYTSTTILCV